MATVLLGDSHLARVRRSLPLIGPDVRNHAVGGATCRSLTAQVDGAGIEPGDDVVVSLGTNDAAQWNAVPPEELAAVLSQVLRPGWVYVAPPGVVEAHVPPRSWTNAAITHHRAAAVAAARSAGAVVVRTDLLLAPIGEAAFDRDGVHLSGAGYRLLLPAVAEAVRAAVPQG